jgi:hypothetical protein
VGIIQSFLLSSAEVTNEAHALNNYHKNMVHEESMEKFMYFVYNLFCINLLHL